MNFLIADIFTTSLAKLTSDEKMQAKATIFDLTAALDIGALLKTRGRRHLTIVASKHSLKSKRIAYEESSVKLAQEFLKLPNLQLISFGIRSKEVAKIASELWPIS